MCPALCCDGSLPACSPRQVSILRELSHPHIVRYLGLERSFDPVGSQGCLSIFLEYVPGGSLSSMVERFGPLPEVRVREVGRDVLTGLEYLHAHGIAHRDVKGANILMSEQGRAKLTDFGHSKRIGQVTRA